MAEKHLENDIDCESDAHAILAGAAAAQAAESKQDCAGATSPLLSRRVTFSDDHIVHQMPGAPSSAGWEPEGEQQLLLGLLLLLLLLQQQEL
jgi:hypothetical protein